MKRILRPAFSQLRYRCFTVGSDLSPFTLSSIQNKDIIYSLWEMRWEQLGGDKRPISEQIFEEVNQRLRTRLDANERVIDITPLPLYIPEEDSVVSSVCFGKGGRKTSKAIVYLLPREKTEDVELLLEDVPALREVWQVSHDTGENFVVNSRPLNRYFSTGEHYVQRVLEPLALARVLSSGRFLAFVEGGGVTGQSDAVRLALARALLIHQPLLKKLLKNHSMLTRDSRKVERKKPGQKKARKKFAWVKR